MAILNNKGQKVLVPPAKITQGGSGNVIFPGDTQPVVRQAQRNTISVEQDGTVINSDAKTLNFLGDSVEVTASGSQARIDITGTVGPPGPAGEDARAVAYDAAINYGAGDLVHDDDFDIYISIIDNNLGNALTNPAAWKFEGGVQVLSDLTDVSNATPVSTNFLGRAGTQWAPIDLPEFTNSSPGVVPETDVSLLDNGGEYIVDADGNWRLDGCGVVYSNTVYHPSSSGNLRYTQITYDNGTLGLTKNSDTLNVHVRDAGINTTQLANLAVTNGKIANNTITSAKIADNAVTTTEILNGAVTTAKIADSAVTSAKIADSNVTTNKLATDAVTAVKIADDAVTTDAILDSNVTLAKVNITNPTAADGLVLSKSGDAFTLIDSSEGNITDYNNAAFGNIDTDGNISWTYSTADNPVDEGQVTIDSLDEEGYLLQFRTQDIDLINSVSVRYFQIGFGSPITFATYAVADLSITDTLVDVSVINGPLSGDDLLANLPANATSLSISVSVNAYRLDLADIHNVSDTAPTDGQVLAWDATDSEWAPSAAGGGAESLNDLSDVTIASIADDQILRYNATTSVFENVALPAAGAIDLNDIDNVSAGNPVDGYIIRAVGSGNSTEWTEHSLNDTMRLYGGVDVDMPSDFTIPSAAGTEAIAIGYNADASAGASIAIGRDSISAHQNASAFGENATTGGNNEVRLGGENAHVTIDSNLSGTETFDNQLASVKYVKDAISDAGRIVTDSVNGIYYGVREELADPWGSYEIDPYLADAVTRQVATSVQFYDYSNENTNTFYAGTFQRVSTSGDQDGGSDLTNNTIPAFFSEQTDVQTDNNIGAVGGEDSTCLGWKYIGYQDAKVWMANPVTIQTQLRWVNHDLVNPSVSVPEVGIRMEWVRIKPEPFGDSTVYDLSDSDYATAISATSNQYYNHGQTVAAGDTVAHDINFTLPQGSFANALTISDDDVIAFRYLIFFHGNEFASDPAENSGISLDIYWENLGSVMPMFGIETVDVSDQLVVESTGDLRYTDNIASTDILVVDNNEGVPFIPGSSIGDGTIDTDKLEDDAVTNAKVADDAIGIVQLSASGTASATTYLRGDNTWAAASGGSGEDYFVANFDGTVPTAAGTNSLAIGEDATADFDDAVIIGYGATVDVASDVDADTAEVDGAVAIGRLAQVTVPSGETNSRQAIAIGERAFAAGQNTIAIGGDNTETGRTSATGAQSMAIGRGASAAGSFATAVGPGATASSGDTVAVGRDTTASAADAVAVGFGSSATAIEAVAMGSASNASANGAVSIGKDAEAQAVDAVAMGDDVLASAVGSVALGSGAQATAAEAIAIGSIKNAVQTQAEGENSIAIGAAANASQANAIAIGELAQAVADAAIAIGDGADAENNDSIAIGSAANASAVNAIAIGKDTVVNNTNSMAIGEGITLSADNVGQIGNATQEVRLGRSTAADDADTAIVTKDYYESASARFVFENDPDDAEDTTSGALSRILLDQDGFYQPSADYSNSIKFLQFNADGTYNLTFDGLVAEADYLFAQNIISRVRIDNVVYIAELDNTATLTYVPPDGISTDTIFVYPADAVTAIAGTIPTGQIDGSSDVEVFISGPKIISEANETITAVTEANGLTLSTDRVLSIDISFERLYASAGVGTSGTTAADESYLSYGLDSTTYYRVFVDGGEEIRDGTAADSTVLATKTYLAA